MDSKNKRRQPTQTRAPVEKALLVGVDVGKQVWNIADSLDELEQLAATAGVDVVGRTSQKLAQPNAATLVGKGKLDEIRRSREELGADVVLFDEELSPSQQRNVEESLNTKVLDRTGLILDIFAKHARTKEGRLQVELAQLEYRLPRLTRMWTHLSRQTAGGVGLRGPGETQLETDRRRSRERIAKLRQELVEVHGHRELYRQKRRKEGLPVVALVGYTNAGKSTLLNALADSDVLAANVLFATLDPTTRQITLPEGQKALLTDTVGFIQKLPTQLVAAFRATLEEIKDADLLVHVLDLTHPNAEEQATTVDHVLGELGVGDKPRIVALNKVDRLFPELPVANGREGGASGTSDAEEISVRIRDDLQLSPDYVPVSARKRWGLEELLRTIQERLNSGLAGFRALVPYDRSDLVSLAHEKGAVESEEHREGGTVITGRLPRRYIHLFEPYSNSS